MVGSSLLVDNFAGGGGLRTDVAALYVDPKGPYPKLVRDWYDEARDAKTYAGPRPVVAHPPCGPWGMMRGLCTKQDKAAGPQAVEMVRRYGGVLEHPQNSRLFDHCGMPRPGEMVDGAGGWTVLVRQVAWGHCCEKPTWLYFVGVDPVRVDGGMRYGGTATHRVTSGPRGPVLPSASALRRRLTPPAFAEWLVELAASARVADGRAA